MTFEIKIILLICAAFLVLFLFLPRLMDIEFFNTYDENSINEISNRFKKDFEKDLLEKRKNKLIAKACNQHFERVKEHILSINKRFNKLVETRIEETFVSKNKSYYVINFYCPHHFFDKAASITFYFNDKEKTTIKWSVDINHHKEEAKKAFKAGLGFMRFFNLVMKDTGKNSEIYTGVFEKCKEERLRYENNQNLNQAQLA